MHYVNDRLVLEKNGNGLVYVNEKLVQQENVILSNGDFIYAYGLKIYFMKNLIIVNNPNNLINIKNSALKNYQLSFGDININSSETPVVENEEITEEDLYKDSDYFFKMVSYFSKIFSVKR